ncbi:unnamed protein product [Thelazia callipaeda]|uniref:Protein-tyrosine phosphatase n=1 Tax=Thelazia callipaeda TaxID=103827 RepID=A0A0N5CW81_THECL|nr:unnamed protein product [Thelazia callipaeda]
MKFSVKPEKFLHDVGDAITLSSFTRRICSMNVYSLFFDYATVISKDTKDTSDICEQHADLNRYKDIRCLDQTRVKVQHATEPHDYINANYVDGFREERKFILTQSPMVNTVESFWTMIYQENVVEIVSMTSMHSSKTFMYMPIKRSDIATFGPYSIRYCGSQQIREAYEATILKLKKGNDQERKILHISFFTWHNKGTPEKPTEMLYLISDLNYNRKLLLEEAQKTGWLKDARSPILVHCLTGAGRSGTLAVLDICCRKMDYTEKTLNGNVLVDVRDTVLRVRTQRDKAVMKPEQYLLLHLLVIEYALRQKYFDDVDFMDLSNYNGTM